MVALESLILLLIKLASMILQILTIITTKVLPVML